MTRVLIAEDDDYKRDLLATEMKSLRADVELVFARSFRGAVDAIEAGGFDLVVLDMTMPTFDPSGPVDIGRYEPFAGMEVLAEMERLECAVPVLVVTQFERFGAGEGAMTLPQLHARLLNEFSAAYRGYVFFNSASAQWRAELANAVTPFLGLERS